MSKLLQYLLFSLQSNDQYYTDRYNLNTSVHEHGKILERTACHMCNTEIGWRTYKVISVQEATTHSRYSFSEVDSTQEESDQSREKVINWFLLDQLLTFYVSSFVIYRLFLKFYIHVVKQLQQLRLDIFAWFFFFPLVDLRCRDLLGIHP